MKNTQELIQILSLRDINDNNFEGISKDIGSPNVFGGQVVAQSLNAAYRTIPEDRILHSLHSYFLLPGNLNLPIVYDVSIIRNGGSFSTRRVTAKQNDKVIFILAASFHKKEEGHEYQKDYNLNIKQPEELLSWTDMLNRFGAYLPKKMREFLAIERPIDFKPVQVVNPLEAKNLPPIADVWFKLKEPGDLSLAIKQQILAYISDYNILTACLNPHASEANFGNTQMASLDHSMWYYRDFDFDDWLLFSIECINTSGARGVAKGNIYNRKGELIASVAQEGLMRPLKK